MFAKLVQNHDSTIAAVTRLARGVVVILLGALLCGAPSLLAQHVETIDFPFEADPDPRYDHKRALVNPRLKLPLQWGSDAAYTEHPSKYAAYGSLGRRIAIVDLTSIQAVGKYEKSLDLDRGVLSYRARLIGGEHRTNRDAVRVMSLSGRPIQWDFRIAEHLHSFVGFIREEKVVTAALFNGNVLGSDTVQVWDVMTGEQLFEVGLPTQRKAHRSEFAPGATSPGGRYAAVGVDDAVILIDLQAEELAGFYCVAPPMFNLNDRDELQIQAVRFSPDGKSLAATGARGSMPYLTIIGTTEEGVTARTFALREHPVDRNVYRSYMRRNAEVDLQWIPGETPMILSSGSVIDPETGERLIGSSISVTGQGEAGDTFTGKAMDSKHVVSARGRSGNVATAVPIPWDKIEKNRQELAKGKSMLEFDLPDTIAMKRVDKLSAPRPEPWTAATPASEVRPQMRVPFEFSQLFIAAPSSTHGIITSTYFNDRRKADGTPMYNAGSVLQKFDLATSTGKQYTMPGGNWTIHDATPDYKAVAVLYDKIPNRVDIWDVKNDATHVAAFRPTGDEAWGNDPPAKVWLLSEEIAVGVGQGGTIYQWDFARGEFSNNRPPITSANAAGQASPHVTRVNTLSDISPDRQLIATRTDKRIAVVDAYTGQTLWNKVMPMGVVPRPMAPTFTRDSKHVYFLDKRANTDVLLCFDARTGRVVKEIPIPLTFLTDLTNDQRQVYISQAASGRTPWISDRHFLMLGKLIFDAEHNSFALRLDDQAPKITTTNDLRMWMATKTKLPGLSHTLLARYDQAVLTEFVLQASNKAREYVLHSPENPGEVAIVNQLNVSTDAWRQAMVKGATEGITKHSHKVAADSRVKLLLTSSVSPGAIEMQVGTSRSRFLPSSMIREEDIETIRLDKLDVRVQLAVDGDVFWSVHISPSPSQATVMEGESTQAAFARQQQEYLDNVPTSLSQRLPGFLFDAVAVRQVPSMLWPSVEEERTARPLAAPLSVIEEVKEPR